MHRLFAGIEPPPAVRDRLLAAMGGVAGARWQRDDQLHLTLRFIGEVDRHVARDLAAALGGVRARPFELTLGAPGLFDRKRGSGHALWIGVTPVAPVAALAQRVEAALARVGVPRETRAFHPHITLARFAQAPLVEGFVGAVERTAFTIDGFALYESTLGADGPDYRVVERYRF